jgi:hypothetical protein
VLIQFSEYVHKSYINADIGNKYFYGTEFVSFFQNLFKALFNDAFCGRGMRLTTRLHPVLTLRMSGVILPLPRTLSWCG